MKSFYILNTKIDDISTSEVIKFIKQTIEQNKKAHICTTNNEFVLEAQRNSIFRKIINSAELSLPDSTGIVWAVKFLFKNTISRIAGVDLFEMICELSAKNEYRIFLLGGKTGVAGDTKKILQMKYPGIHIVGFLDGIDINPHEKNLDLISTINESRAQVIAVALGAPKQELWIDKNRELIKSNIFIGLGGSFDYISGRVKRAPKKIRELGLEWLFRLFSQPSRLGRILKAVVIFPTKVIFQKIKLILT